MKDRDYTNYSIAELREAISSVDGNRFPENKAALEAELQKRVVSGEVEREEQEQEREAHAKKQRLRRFARGSRKWIGLYLMGAPLILLNAGTEMPEAFGWIAYVMLGLAALYVCLSAMAGYGLWKHKEWGRRLAIGVFALQVINFQSGFLHYSLASAISGFFYIAAPGNIDFGVTAHLSTGEFRFLVGDLPLTFFLGFNLFALFIIELLRKARQPLDDEETGIEINLGEDAGRETYRSASTD